ncbi:MAG: hypothetical protein IJV22_07245 [Bacteroidales bacterium]|nr:hypothetical protein [Bacteroidales bacterium]
MGRRDDAVRLLALRRAEGGLNDLVGLHFHVVEEEICRTASGRRLLGTGSDAVRRAPSVSTAGQVEVDAWGCAESDCIGAPSEE